MWILASNCYKLFWIDHRRNLVTPSEYAVDIWIGRFCNGLAITNVEGRQALLELLVVFNGQGSFCMDPGIVFEMLRSTRR